MPRSIIVSSSYFFSSKHNKRKTTTEAKNKDTEGRDATRTIEKRERKKHPLIEEATGL